MISFSTLANRKMIRDKLHNTLKDFVDINLDSEIARDAIIDRIIDIVLAEPIEPKYWLKASRPKKVHPAGQNYTIGHPKNTSE
tara:strand:- start:147 stop:395 length:249 start_codon:yes stop_codon:yes gene_type:complete